MSRHSQLSIPNAEFAALIAGQSSQSLPEDLIAVREVFKTAYAKGMEEHFGSTLPPASEYSVQDYNIPVGDPSDEILIRCLVPSFVNKPRKTFPLLVWYHGGGWVAGYAAMDDYLLRHICVEMQISVMNVDYRLAPEFPFPTGVNDSYAALKWAVCNTALLSVDLSKGFIVSGLSAGGNIAAAIAVRARDDPFFKSQPLTGQILHSPAVVHMDAYPDKYKDELKSAEEFAEAEVLRGSSFHWFYGLLRAPAMDPDISPLLATTHVGLPPLCMHVSGMDPLRDENFLYTEVLKEQGVRTKLFVAMVKISWPATRFRVFLSNYVHFWTILERFQGVHRLAFAHVYPSRASG
ncbi:Esterase/lipase/thioesterase [Heterobasidion irregulare TC 32-1]|uniref:Esterase/lipase/thioesterase n=1 Tax=Heterobasidion irregulare (strain TC 32-1) TaxID=747525 RepID=W4JPX2_HETIT|nr:Esterase/lipase/thioesterase [Heterobasidion irregulare TC 32-1]ETW74926.1 Esterase/lipase/thioesterase [Heterobasidion irregulare TC 32-1]